MNKEKTCSNCKHWILDKTENNIFPEPNMNTQYGKCQAKFTGSDGKPARFDIGTIGSTVSW